MRPVSSSIFGLHVSLPTQCKSVERSERLAHVLPLPADASSSSAPPASKKAKAASSSKSAADGKKAKKGDEDDKPTGGAALVELKGSKFDFKQKPVKVSVTMSFLNGASHTPSLSLPSPSTRRKS